jgi:RNA polymerase sigma-70 factor (ECF subfamily)
MKRVMQDHAEDALVRAAQKGSVQSFTELARLHQEKIYHAVFGLTRSHTDADDLTQETFMTAYRSLKRFRRKCSFYTWLYRIAINLTFNHLKKAKRERGNRPLDERIALGGDPGGEVSSPERDSLNSELKERIKDAIESLPRAYRTTFNLVVTEGMTHAQAAYILGSSENTVSWRIHKARKMLQASLKPYLGEDKNAL